MKTPDALAVVAGDGEFYSELDQGTDALGAYLRHHGVSLDDRVGVFMETCPEYVLASIGTPKAGAAFMPMVLESPDNLLRNIVAEARPKLVITKDQHVSRVNQITEADILAIDGDQAWRAFKDEDPLPTLACHVTATTLLLGRALPSHNCCHL